MLNYHKANNNNLLKLDPDWQAILTSQTQMKQLRKKIVSADESEMNELKPRMTAHLRVSKPQCSTKLSVEQDSEGDTEYVKDGSVATQSGTAQHSREHLTFGLGIEPKEIAYISEVKMSETYSLPKRSSKDTNTFHKKAKQNFSELAEPRRFPTACFGHRMQRKL